MNIFRYGIFRLGQIWTLTGEHGARLGFISRDVAIAALETVIAGHRAAGASVLVTLQDGDGRLRTTLDPGMIADEPVHPGVGGSFRGGDDNQIAS